MSTKRTFIVYVHVEDGCVDIDRVDTAVGHAMFRIMEELDLNPSQLSHDIVDMGTNYGNDDEEN